MQTKGRMLEPCPTLQSLPSDEWGTRRSDKGESSNRISHLDDGAQRSEPRSLAKRFAKGGGESMEEEESTRQSGMFAKSSSYNSNSFAGYLSHLIPTRNGKSMVTDTRTYTTTMTDGRADIRATESRATERSTHSRCIIENTESIQERRDDVDDARRDENDDMMSSVEEISQISDITMDIRTYMAESKFGACSTLPTIAEARRYDPVGCVSPMSMEREPEHTTDEPKSSHRRNLMDFVFELVEDAICTPLNESKVDKKAAFAKAFPEETVNLSSTNSLVDAFHATSSNFSRSNRTQRRSGNGNIIQATSNVTHLSPSSTRTAVDGVTVPTSTAPPVPSLLAKNHSAYVIVDRPPSPPPTIAEYDKVHSERRTSSATVDDEQTLDWSKIMSFAERQLEAGDDKSVYTNTTGSRFGKTGRPNRRSFFDNNSTTGDIKPNNTLTSFATAKSKLEYASTAGKPVPAGTAGKTFVPDSQPTASTSSNSVSTHATASGASSTSHGSAAVQELREISAMDSSSFDVEPRLLLTSLLVRLVKHLIPVFLRNNDVKDDGYEPSEGPSASVTSDGPTNISRPSSSQITPRKDYSDENIIFKALRYTVFILAFIFWPEGIPRRKIEYPPLPKKVEKPSLLKLVSETPEEEQR